MTASNNLQTLSPPRSPPRWLAAGLFLLTLTGPLASGWLTLAGCDPFAINGGATRFFTGLFSGLAFAILGLLIFVYQPHNRIGWLCLITGFSLHADSATDVYIQCGLAGTITAPGVPYAAWLLYATGGAAIIPLQVLLPMMFPNGRFLSYRWRWVTLIGLVISLGAAAALGLMPDFSQDNGFETRFPVANPFGVTNLPDWWLPFFRTISVGMLLLLILLGIISLVVRFRRSAGDERQQIKWLVYYLATGIGIQILLLEIPATFFYPQLWDSVWYAIILPLVFGGIPIVMGIAIFKYRLYAIDVVINRTLVYGSLTLLITAVYVLLVSGVGTLAANQSGQVIGLVLATAIVVVGIRPLHRALQMNVNRFVAVSPSPQRSPIGRGSFASPPVGETEGGLDTLQSNTLPPPNLPPSTSSRRRLLGGGTTTSPPAGGTEGGRATLRSNILPPPNLPPSTSSGRSLLGGGATTSLPVGGTEGGRTVREPISSTPNTETLGKPIPNTPPDPRLRWLAIALFLVAPMALLALALLVLAGCASFSYLGVTGILVSFASGMAFSTLGVLILAYRPHNRIGWLCLWIGIGLPCVSAIDIYANCGIAGHIAAPGLAYLAWFSYSFGVFFPLVPMFILLPMLYPTGKFLSPRWQWMTVAGLLVVTINGAAIGLLPDLSQDNGFETLFTVANPFGISHLPEWWYSFFSSSSNLTIITLSLVGITAMVVRFRRSVGDERQQMKWLAYFLGTTVVVQLLFFELPGAFFYPEIFSSIWYKLIIIVVFLGFPIIIGIAIFKYRLYAIDVVINRTLVYGGLTLVVVLIYTLTVGGLSLFFHTAGSLPISLIATVLIAIAFQPAREYLQRSVNRFMFGQRDDPYAVLSHLSQQLQTTAVPAETLTSIVETIAGTLKLPYAAIELVEQAEQIGQAAVGEPVAEVVELPLRYQKETVGRLMVSPRAPGETFTAKEQKLLADIAAQTGPVASATRLTLALQRSRERLVLAREEERRRIRRDLHDGLGPTLASQTLKLDAVLDLLTANPDAAGQHVTQLKEQTQQMVADIRRLVYELRPPALDELGLLEALRAHVAQMGGLNGRLHIAIETAPEPLPPLPAAIEVAAYRIALEGVTNVIRHAQARQCQVRFAITEGQPLPGLVITITDDGRGLPVKFRAGVGLISMRERAEELGGTCTVGVGHSRGTQVRAVLPFSVSS